MGSRADLDLVEKKYLASARNLFPIPQFSKPIA
jgi:hypothetical protein